MIKLLQKNGDSLRLEKFMVYAEVISQNGKIVRVLRLGLSVTSVFMNILQVPYNTACHVRIQENYGEKEPFSGRVIVRYGTPVVL